MKFEWNKKYTTVAIYSFLVIVASILFFTILQNFSGFSNYASKILTLLTPFIYGFVIAYILNPILRMFDRKLLPWMTKDRIKPKHRRMLSILLTYVVAILFLIVFFSFVIPEIVTSLTGIVTKFPDYLKTAEQWIAEIFTAVEAWGINDINIQKILQTVLLSFDEWLEKGYQIIKESLPMLLNTTKQLADGIMNIILGIIISVYLLMSKEKFFAQFKKALYALLPAKSVERSVYIAHKSHVTFSGFINGKLLDSLIIGILCFIGMTLLKMPNVMLISVIVGVTNVIPYFGPFIGAIPGALIILLTDPAKTIWFLIFILALQQFDGNILGPKILGETTGISAFWVIFAIVVFSGLLGVLGMFIGVPLFAVIYTLIREYIDARLEKKGLSVKTAEYASDKHKIEF
ncbi:AI-2E family transporter [Hydrogenoanaerobacterium sp.]|uniref:AI-2E family transporter n=1 Tax=Hydrogenoanaerobacterium sp. TaxID=2953763 RepID=UPI00289F5B0C|nr:AI-2E family transporter [Hydrogenoanaerobacterium sp.]